MSGHEHSSGGGESLTIPACVAVIVMLVSCAGFLLTVVGVLGCATVAAVMGEMPDVPIDVYVLVMVSLVWTIIVVGLGDMCVRFDVPRVIRILLDVVMIALTLIQFSCVGIAAYRMAVALAPSGTFPENPIVSYQMVIDLDDLSEGELPERIDPEPMTVEAPEECPSGDGITAMETDKGWDVYPQLSPDDALDYAERCRIPRLAQVYDGKRLMLEEY